MKIFDKVFGISWYSVMTSPLSCVQDVGCAYSCNDRQTLSATHTSHFSLPLQAPLSDSSQIFTAEMLSQVSPDILQRALFLQNVEKSYFTPQIPQAFYPDFSNSHHIYHPNPIFPPQTVLGNFSSKSSGFHSEKFDHSILTGASQDVNVLLRRLLRSRKSRTVPLFIFHMPREMGDMDLKELFEPFGELHSVKAMQVFPCCSTFLPLRGEVAFWN